MGVSYVLECVYDAFCETCDCFKVLLSATLKKLPFKKVMLIGKISLALTFQTRINFLRVSIASPEVLCTELPGLFSNSTASRIFYTP